jgi:hypothetical protein
MHTKNSFPKMLSLIFIRMSPENMNRVRIINVSDSNKVRFIWYLGIY